MLRSRVKQAKICLPAVNFISQYWGAIHGSLMALIPTVYRNTILFTMLCTVILAQFVHVFVTLCSLGATPASRDPLWLLNESFRNAVPRTYIHISCLYSYVLVMGKLNRRDRRARHPSIIIEDSEATKFRSSYCFFSHNLFYNKFC